MILERSFGQCLLVGERGERKRGRAPKVKSFKLWWIGKLFTYGDVFFHALTLYALDTFCRGVNGFSLLMRMSPCSVHAFGGSQRGNEWDAGVLKSIVGYFCQRAACINFKVVELCDDGHKNMCAHWKKSKTNLQGKQKSLICFLLINSQFRIHTHTFYILRKTVFVNLYF